MHEHPPFCKPHSSFQCAKERKERTKMCALLVHASSACSSIGRGHNCFCAPEPAAEQPTHQRHFAVRQPSHLGTTNRHIRQTQTPGDNAPAAQEPLARNSRTRLSAFKCCSTSFVRYDPPSRLGIGFIEHALYSDSARTNRVPQMAADNLLERPANDDEQPTPL